MLKTPVQSQGARNKQKKVFLNAIDEKSKIICSKVFSFPGNWDTAGGPQHTPPLKMSSPILSPWSRSNAKEQRPNFKTAATPQTLRNSTAPQQLLSATMIHNH